MESEPQKQNRSAKKGKNMKLTINGRQMSVRESLKEMVEKKLAKFDRIFGSDAEATVTTEFTL